VEAIRMARRPDHARRASIVETALRAFGERGFRSTTIKRIAARAGVAPGSIYTYFRDKDELFRRSVDEGWRAFLSSLDAIGESAAPPPAKLERLLEAGFAVLSDRLPLVRGIVFEAGRRDVLRRMIEELCARVEGILAGGPGAPMRSSRANWSAMLRVTVAGIMFTAAAAPPGRAAAEIASMRRAVTALVNERRVSTEAGR
jgi:AcrR family transcriptional regulator